MEIKLQSHRIRYLGDTHFMSLFYYCAYKNGIKVIRDCRHLSIQLLPFKDLDKYSILFKSIPVTSHDRLDIDDAIANYKALGTTTYLSSNRHKLYIRHYNEQDDKHFTTLYSEEQISAMMELTKEFAIRDEIESNFKDRLMIYPQNPNGSYTIKTGHYSSLELPYEESIITDGIINSHDILTSKKGIAYVDSITSVDTLLGLKKSIIKEVNVTDASYVIIQSLCDKQCLNKLFSLSLDKEELQKTLSLINSCYVPTTTDTKPYVKTFQRSINKN